MPDTLQFVDAISATPTVRLDLNDDATWSLDYEGTDFSPPPLRRAIAQTLLTDGGLVAAAVYDLRIVKLQLDLKVNTVDEVAEQLQALNRELDRPTNLLKYQPGTGRPVFIRTLRSAATRVRDYPGPGTFRTVNVEVLAEPFALGIKETLPAVTVSNDPDSPAPANANPYFETNAASWTPTGGTFVRSTAQFHQGSASGLLTPDGVTAQVRVESEQVTVTAGGSYRASAWLRCASTRNIDVNINWFSNSGATYLSTSTVTVAVTAATWTYGELTATAPAGADRATVQVSMTGTPPASDLVYIDEAMIRADDIGQVFDVTGVLGDVETPLYLSVGPEIQNGGPTTTAIAVRRRGTPSGAPAVLQAEAMTTGTDTSVQPYDATMSGTGSNFMRVTFATATALGDRLFATNWPAGASADLRGTYRMWVRVRKSVAGDTITMRWLIYSGGPEYVGDTYTLPSGTNVMWQDLGLVSIPFGLDPVSDGLSGVELPAGGWSQLRIQAGRTAGSGNLDIDCIILVPADDRLDLVQWPAYGGPTALVLDATRNWAYALGSSGEVRGNDLGKIAGGAPMVSPGVTNRIWFVRNVGGAVNSDNLTRTTAVTPYYWPRYLHIRGAST